MREPYTWEYFFEDHEIGNPKCDWCFTDGYPKQHSCGGLIHIHYEDDDGINCYFIRCDKCGYEEEL